MGIILFFDRLSEIDYVFFHQQNSLKKSAPKDGTVRAETCRRKGYN
jgi:hypothetical protein